MSKSRRQTSTFFPIIEGGGIKGFGVGEENQRVEKEKKTRFWQIQMIVFGYYNTILHYSDYIHIIFVLFGVENQTIFRPGGEGNQRPGGKEIKSRSTLYTPL